ncbi:MAG: DUF262 domain-containing protein [Thermodesulfovibrionales bacterium]|nr:DUF262 domain-containing protein [Thermodesulfovibrionales bacterium]
MNKTDISVKELIGMIDRRELALPELQRRYVWRSTRVRDLLDSLYRGYPSGSILIWETDQEHSARNFSVSQGVSPFTGCKLLLDGQQRLTSLKAIIKGEPITVRDKKKKIDILFNLDHPEKLDDFTEVTDDAEYQGIDEEEIDEIEEGENSIQDKLANKTFVVGAKSLAQQSNWVSVSTVFKSDDISEILESIGITSPKDPKWKKYSIRLQKLRNISEYSYVMHVLPRDLSYEEVADIFVRVNSLGVKLRGSDLALAQITARWRNSLGLLEEFQKECEVKWMTLDLGILVRAMVVFATGQSRFNSVSTIPVNRLKQGWEDAKEGLRIAINFLRANAQIDDESLLSSPQFFITIAYYYFLKNQKITQSEGQSLLYWLFIANARGHYSKGSSETILDADLTILKNGGDVKELIGAIRQQFGRLTFDIEDIKEKGVGSPIFSLLFLTMKSNGAKDWRTGLGLSLTHQGRLHIIQHHHIFPKSLLKGKYDKKEINEIANMAFISGRINREISASEPKDYFPEIIRTRGVEALSLQLIPLDQKLHSVDSYSLFLEKRRKALVDAVNSFLEGIISDSP